MKYYFCLISEAESKMGTKVGRTNVYNKRSEWKTMPDDVCSYLTAGFMKGIDFVTYKNKAYWIMKAFIDIEEHFVVLACVESVAGCDN